jgi:hypothetical protein
MIDTNLLPVVENPDMELGPKSMDLVEYLLRCSTKQNLVELGEITHHYH